LPEPRISLHQSALQRWWSLGLLLLAADQVLKYWVITALGFGERVFIWPIFDLTRAHNLGAAFSFLADAGGWQRWLFTAISMGVSLVLVVWLRRLPRQQWMLGLALILVLAGAVGNLLDRLLHGYVIDFISLHYQQYYFPAFNLADTVICCGAFGLLLDAWRGQPTNSS
jgi:signal peptidase II